jgi:hypothetical protein
MMRHRRFFSLAALSGTLLLSGCLGPTPYQLKQFNGGYQERAVAADRWYVEFFGNGHTSRDTVFAYWIYRCAEVTQQKGFDYFVIVARTPQASPAADVDIRYGSADADGDDAAPSAIRAKGTGGSGSRTPSYTSVPGSTGTITTWSARGVIQVFKGLPDPDERAFVAKEIVEKLGPAVRLASQSGTNVKLPPNYLAASVPEPPAAPGNGVGVRMDDLKDLLPKD